MSIFVSQLVVEQRLFWRNRSSVMFTFILPIVLLVALSSSRDPSESAAFIAALSIVSTGFQGLAMQLAMHRDQGVLKLLMASPLPASTLIVAKAVSTLVTVLIELAVIVAIAVVGFGAPFPNDLAALLVAVMLGVLAFVAMGFALASVIPSAESAPAVVNGAYLGLMLLTAAMSQLKDLPEAVRIASDCLPFTALLHAIDEAWFGPWDGIPWLAWGATVGWGVVATIWTVRRFRWEPAHER